MVRYSASAVNEVKSAKVGAPALGRAAEAKGDRSVPPPAAPVPRCIGRWVGSAAGPCTACARGRPGAAAVAHPAPRAPLPPGLWP
jgi:hypothetical protein